jgi:hypothetical protein
MKAFRFVLALFLRNTVALMLIGATILLLWAVWQFLTGGAP